MTTNRSDSRSVCCSGPEGTMAALLAGQAAGLIFGCGAKANNACLYFCPTYFSRFWDLDSRVWLWWCCMNTSVMFANLWSVSAAVLSSSSSSCRDTGYTATF